MKYLLFIFKSAIFDFSRNKGRTFLTSLGIMIGVLAVVLLMASGLGLKKYIENQFNSLGSNLIFVIPGNKKAIFQGGGAVGGIKFDNKDVLKLKRVSGITNLAPIFAKKGVKITAGGNMEIVDIIASNEEIISIFNLEAEEGRLLEKSDADKTNKIILLSSTIAKKLFNTNDVIGKTVVLEAQNFKIVGVLKAKGGGLGGNDLDANVYIPYKSAYSFNTDKKFYAIYLKTETKEDITRVKNQVEQILLKRYDKDDFTVIEQSELVNTITSIFNIVNIVLVAIAAISLLVGGIGIMNIMYVTVTERIKEIGIRRALGARKKDILFQFLIESIILSLLGGIVGLGLSFIIVFLIQSIFPAYINLESIVLSLGSSSAIGIIFGVFPAKKAADLSPIEAIRYE
jgi:putative ABC transport system permease protein